MANALVRKLMTAKAGEANPAELLREHLQEKCAADSRVSTLVFVLLGLSTVMLVTAVVVLVMGDAAKGLPVLGVLAKMPDEALQTLAYVCVALASALFVSFIRLRQEQTKHAFLLIMVVNGEVGQAAVLLFGGHGKNGIASEVLKTFLGAVAPG